MNEASPKAIKASREAAVDALLKIKWYAEKRGDRPMLASLVVALAVEGLNAQLDALMGRS